MGMAYLYVKKFDNFPILELPTFTNLQIRN